MLTILFQKEYTTFTPELMNSTKPLLDDDEETKLELPFYELNENTHPDVIFLFS